MKVERGIEARVAMDIVRPPERKRRVGPVCVVLHAPDDLRADALEACKGVLEDFCTVTASVRQGIEVDVSLEADQSTG